MRECTSLLLSLLFSYCLIAQPLTGEYFITGQGGTITLSLQQSSEDLQGTLTDMQGIVYEVQAEVADGEAFGTLSTQQGTMYFEAFRKKAELYLTLIPTSATGQPDPSRAKEFVMMAKKNNDAPGTAVPEPIMVENNPTPKPPKGIIGGPLGGPLKPSGTNWDGTFSGNIMGTATTIQIQVQGDQLSGIVNAGGYRYNLQGTASGNQSRGKLQDPRTQGYFNYTAVLKGDQLDLIMQNPTNGQSQQIAFSRSSPDQLTE